MNLSDYSDEELKEELRRRHPYANRIQSILSCEHKDVWPASAATAYIATCKKCGARKGPSGGWW